MQSQRRLVVGLIIVVAACAWLFLGCGSGHNVNAAGTQQPGGSVNHMSDKVVKTDEEWHKLLTDEQFSVARKKGTERAFTGAYWNLHDHGIFKCVCCGADLFDSDHKFDSGTGWPSFWAPMKENNIVEHSDRTFGMERTEILCKRCDAHLGHVFPDGPKPTNLRYCINSAALKFEKTK